MARKLKSDNILFLAALALMCASIVMVSSASSSKVLAKPDQQWWLLLKQTMWTAAGVSILGLAMRFDYRHFRQPAVIWTMVGVSGVGLVAVYFCPAVNHSHRWINVGGFGIQPSEFAKLATIVFTAAVLELRMVRINDLAYSLSPIAIAVLVLGVLIEREPDGGAAFTLVAIVATMVFAAGLAWRYLVTAALGLIPLTAVIVLTQGYRLQRFMTFFDPEKDPLGLGFQVIQSKIAVGTGGVFGRGLGGGLQKLSFLPMANNDFIYAVIAEELGLVGASAILLCFLVVVWRGLRIASRAPDAFGALLAIGITAMIGLQSLANMSVVLGLMPTKGVALPLVSAGGSSLLVNTLAIGILLNISQHASAEA